MEFFKAIREIIRDVNLPMIIDAEAVRAIAEGKEISRNNIAKRVY